MCLGLGFKYKTEYGMSSFQPCIIAITSILSAAFGVTILIMAIIISVKSSWLTDLLNEADKTGSLAGFI